MFRHIRKYKLTEIFFKKYDSRSPTYSPNLTFFTSRKLHISTRNTEKLYVNVENEYAYSVLPQLTKIELSWQPEKEITGVEDLERFLDQNWRCSNAAAIVAAFETAKDASVAHSIPLSSPLFDKLVDGLVDHCENLTDDHLIRLLLLIAEYPSCESSTSRNFHDIWSCLDDICCWKMSQWDLEKMFLFANLWYKLNLARLSDYVFEVLDKAAARGHRLSKTMLLYTFFYFNVNRRRDVPFELERALERRLGEFGVDALGVIAMGYFKTKTKVKLKTIVAAMIAAVGENCETINEITLATILKAIRLSQNVGTAPDLLPMLDRLTHQIPRLSPMSLVHVALLGTSLQLKHESSVKKCTERIVADVENVRLKDIERMLLVCSMFNIETDLYQRAFEEIRKDNRRKEMLQYNRCLPSILNYLSLRQIYSPEHMNELLNEEYINETFGKSPKVLPRELFSLDICIDIECPNYGGNRLGTTKRYKAAKWFAEYAPSRDQTKRLSLSDKLYLDVSEHVQLVVGEERFLRSDHVLPHFSKSDIIVVKDVSNGEFVEPFGFENYILGDVKWPLEVDKYKWFAVVVLTPNLTVRNAVEVLGQVRMKERQLRAVGYVPVLVHWSEFSNLSHPEKVRFISSRLF